MYKSKEQILCQHLLDSCKSSILSGVVDVNILSTMTDVYDCEQSKQLSIAHEKLKDVERILTEIFWDKYSEHDTDCEDSRQLNLSFVKCDFEKVD